MIPHGWTAVSRYGEIADDFMSSYDEGDELMRFVILINCGASEDMRSLLGLNERPNVCLVIIDSHRPIMHAFNDDSPDVFVLLNAESEDLHLDDIPRASLDGDSSSSDVEDSDRENDVENMPPRQRRRLEPDVAAEGNLAAREIKRREKRNAEDARILYYEKGTSWGTPSACILFDLAYNLQQDSSHLLWLALVGLTDHLVHDRISQDKYEEYLMHYENHIAQLGHYEESKFPEIGIDGEAGSVTARSCRIAVQEDFRFGLLREWNLWEAMVNSPYAAARLQTYTEKGKHRLELLLAKLGIPLREAHSSFQFDMKPRFREKLLEQIRSHGSTFNLADAIFKSFQLQDGYARCVMAVDVVYAITALLESSDGYVATEQGTSLPRDNFVEHQDRFWRCWNALSWRNDCGELRRGIELAKRVQKALISDGGAVLAQKLFHNFRVFRIFDLSDHSLSNQSLLAHPLVLRRMAAFFQEQHFFQSNSNRRKPVVLIGPKSADSGKCLIVGYQVISPGKGNRLGTAFQAAAEEVAAQAWHDLFDTSIMEIASEDVERFKAELLRVATDLL